MAVLFKFEVHTPYRFFFNERAEVIILQLIDGEIGLYANHSPFTAPVTPCILSIKDSKGKWRYAFVSGGILEVKEHKYILLADIAEWPEDIDKVRSLASKEEAEKELEKTDTKVNREKLKETIHRANYRLKLLDMQKNPTA